MLKNWYKRSTQKFRFTAKFPKIITHDKRLKDVDKELERFLEPIRPLADKTLALLIQLPPTIHIFEGLERLRDLVPAPYVPVKARVEELGRIFQGSALKEGQLHYRLVRLSRADAPVMGPYRGSPPLPLFHNIRVGLPDEGAHPC